MIYRLIRTNLLFHGRSYQPGAVLEIAAEDLEGIQPLVDDGTLEPVDDEDPDDGGEDEEVPRDERLRSAADVLVKAVPAENQVVFTRGGALRIDVLERITGLRDVTASERDMAQAAVPPPKDPGAPTTEAPKDPGAPTTETAREKGGG